MAMLRVGPTLIDTPAWIALALGAICGYLLADLFSGTVHWIADRFFDPRTPILGPALIAPFREHHADALAMTRHDFFEISGNNGLATIPLAGGLLLMPLPTSCWAQGFTAALACFGLSIVVTNQIHCWAHRTHAPRAIRLLQRFGLILSPERHAIHHRESHDRAYCVTSGWLNPLLDRTRFFAHIEQRIASHRDSTEGRI
jgi:ubiquitin-conjugating enzyme E2 variant